jgi:hypothetical protein
VFACYRLWNGDKGRRMFNESHGHRRVRNGSLGQRNGGQVTRMERSTTAAALSRLENLPRVIDADWVRPA